MDDSDSSPSANIEILAQFAAELEGAPDVSAVLQRFSAMHPGLARELHEQAAMIQLMIRSQPGNETPWPARLGEFRIERRLPGGGMGDVFEAIQTSLNRRVAVKTIRSNRISPLAKARFLREQKVLASLHQTNIVSIHTAGTQGPLDYFAMPFIEGATLSQLIDAVRVFQADNKSTKTPSLAEMAARPTQACADDSTLGAPQAPAPAHVDRQTSPLSQAYFSSVASIMIDAAVALQHAHDQGILHRDLKPSNLMVDTAGRCWIIDFGLASSSGRSRTTGSGVASAADDQGAITKEGILGTPMYMAPEQWNRGHVDSRADVWGLGATLYELLTLRRPFEGRNPDELKAAICHTSPPSPRRVIPNVPRDLAAICSKALQKNVDARYASAGAFGDDLRRWLQREPTSARRSVFRRVYLWSTRNKGWAAAVVLAVAALGGLVAAAEMKAESATARERSSRREIVLQQLQSLVQGNHVSEPNKAWRDEALRQVDEAVQLRSEPALRDYVASALAGIDGHLRAEYSSFDASSVALSADGEQLLVGGAGDKETRTGARLWDLKTQRMRESSAKGPGPVAFTSDGQTRQLIVDPAAARTLLLWDLDADRLVREFQLPPEASDVASASSDHPLICLTADGTFAAASTTPVDDKYLVLVWDCGTGGLVRRVECVGAPPSALALDPSGTLVAIGQRDCQIAVWPLPAGDPKILRGNAHTTTHSMAFGRTAAMRETGLSQNRLLAVSHGGGIVVIWDLDRGIPRSYCHGTPYGVYAVAFSPDGMTLATTGRGFTGLWDTATGHLLLRLKCKDSMNGLSFSADGRQLAASSISVFGGEGGVQVWNLEMGRGIRTLRGLGAPVAKICFAASGERLAALSHDWQIAVWNLKSGFLEKLIAAPEGVIADNAALRFSPDQTQLAFAAGREARLWNLASDEVRQWQFPRGLCDSLAFSPDGNRLYLYRAERDDEGPINRMRNLLSENPATPLWTHRDFDHRTLNAQISADAAWVGVEGSVLGPQGNQRKSLLLSANTGQPHPWVDANSPQGAAFRFDSSGKYLAISTDTGGADIVELPDCRRANQVRIFPECLTANGGLGALRLDTGFALFGQSDAKPLVTLGIHIDVSSIRSEFSSDGNLVAWGNSDATVSVGNLQELKRQLSTFGLAW